MFQNVNGIVGLECDTGPRLPQTPPTYLRQAANDRGSPTPCNERPRTRPTPVNNLLPSCPMVTPNLSFSHWQRSTVLAAFLALSANLAASEFRQNSSQLLSALEGSAVMQCRADSLSAGGPLSQPVKRDRQCLIQPTDASKKSWSLIVDTRPATEFLRGQIPGAVNMTIPQLLATPGGVKQSILIYDRGTVQADAEVTCARLRSQGFNKAHILIGGYGNWARSQAGVDLLSAVSIQPAELFAEISSGSPLVVVLGEKLPTTALGRRVLRIPDADAVDVPSTVQAALRQSANRSVTSVLMVGEPVIPDTQWLRWLADFKASLPTLIHSTSPAELDKSLASLNALWAKRTQEPTSPRGCSAS